MSAMMNTFEPLNHEIFYHASISDVGNDKVLAIDRFLPGFEIKMKGG
jgi:hypothetical protein